MEVSKGKISAFQFFVMLFLSRTLTTVTYLSSYTENIRLSDMLVQPIFRIAIGTLIMLVIFCRLFHVKFLRFLNVVASGDEDKQIKEFKLLAICTTISSVLSLIIYCVRRLEDYMLRFILMVVNRMV